MDKHIYDNLFSIDTQKIIIKTLDKNYKLVTKNTELRFEGWSFFFKDWKNVLRNTYKKDKDSYNDIHWEPETQIFGFPMNIIVTTNCVPVVYFHIDKILELHPSIILEQNINDFKNSTVITKNINNNSVTDVSVPVITMQSFGVDEEKILIDGNHRFEKIERANGKYMKYYYFTIEEIIKSDCLMSKYEKVLLAYFFELAIFSLKKNSYSRETSLIKYFFLKDR